MKNDELVRSHDGDKLPEQSDLDTARTLSTHLDDETLPKLKVVSSQTNGHLALPVTPIEGDWDIPITPFTQDETETRETLPLPAFHLRYIVSKNAGDNIKDQLNRYAKARGVAAPSMRRRMRLSFFKDGWLIATFMIACIVGSFSLWYFFVQHETLLYGDAYAHLLIARRLFDNVTPGLAQLGGIWLPLPHLLIVPFVWNDYLWRTGLAGSIVSLLSYVIASVYVFLSARRLTKNGMASFAGTLVFILNPNILYLQSTPLSELVLISTLTAACYYFLVWSQTDSLRYLILAAGATFLATLARYDGWALFLALLVLIVIIGWVRYHKRTRIEANLIIFGSMGGIGIALWFLWNAIIFGDPLYFQRGPFSAQSQQRDLINSHLLYTYHDIVQSIRYYLIDCIDIVGPILFALGVIALLVFLWRRRFTSEMFAALAFLVPIPFYIVSLYSGQASLYLPTAVPGYAPYQLFNARYGEVIVVPAAIFLAFLADFLVTVPLQSPNSFARRFGQTVSRYTVPLVCIAVIIAQSALIVNTGIITLQDGQSGLACTPTHTIVIYLAEHYAGGKILEDLYTSKVDALEPTANIDFKNIVYEGSGQLWTEAISHPQQVVDWIIVNTNASNASNDYIARKINLTSTKFTSQFSFVLQEPNGLTLYHRNGLPPLPWHQVSQSIYTEHSLCEPYNNLSQLSEPPVVTSKDTSTTQQLVLRQVERAR